MGISDILAELDRLKRLGMLRGRDMVTNTGDYLTQMTDNMRNMQMGREAVAAGGGLGYRDIPKEEQDSNWMMRPLRPSQVSYAARDANLLLPLLRALGDEAEARRGEPAVAAALARLPAEIAALKARVRAYRPPGGSPMLDKIRRMGLGAEAERKASRLLDLRYQWGNEGDVAAVMELGARWILARLHRPPRSREELERVIPNPRFRRRRLEALWEILGDPDPVRVVDDEAVPEEDSA